MTPDQQRPDDEREWREEAERLRQLPVATQRQVIELVRAPSRSRDVPKPDRDQARRRAAALEKYLGLK